MAFLFPSQMEGFGFAPAEAMACGTPAIVSNKGSLPEIVSHGTNGFILSIDSTVDEWVNSMSQLINNRDLREKFSKSGVEHIHNSFDWNSVNKQTADFFTNIIDDLDRKS